MSNESSKSNILAHWMFTNEQSHEYLYYEKLEFESRNLVDVRMILTFGVAVVFIIAVIGCAKGGAAVFFFVLIAGSLFFGLCYLIHYLVCKNAGQKMNKQTGEVIISLNGISTNGVNFNWDFMKPGLSFEKVERKSVTVNPQKMFEILEFYTINHTTIDRRRLQEKFECRVPIPSGKESEAEIIMNRLRSHLLSAEQVWLRENFTLGHEFSMGVCRKCGETIAEAASYIHRNCRGL